MTSIAQNHGAIKEIYERLYRRSDYPDHQGTGSIFSLVCGEKISTLKPLTRQAGRAFAGHPQARKFINIIIVLHSADTAIVKRSPYKKPR